MFKTPVYQPNSGVLIVGTSTLSPQISNASSERSSAPLIGTGIKRQFEYGVITDLY